MNCEEIKDFMENKLQEFFKEDDTQKIFATLLRLGIKREHFENCMGGAFYAGAIAERNRMELEKKEQQK